MTIYTWPNKDLTETEDERMCVCPRRPQGGEKNEQGGRGKEERGGHGAIGVDFLTPTLSSHTRCPSWEWQQGYATLYAASSITAFRHIWQAQVYIASSPRFPWRCRTTSLFLPRLARMGQTNIMQLSLKRRAIQAPAGFVYSGHSCRAGSLSEASALGVPIVRLRFVGGFAVGSRVPEDKYIDPTCPPSPAGAFFFGWLQPPRSTFVDFSFGNVDSIINPSEPSASRREQPARQV
jgi:hypothetical protein